MQMQFTDVTHRAKYNGEANLLNTGQSYNWRQRDRQAGSEAAHDVRRSCSSTLEAVANFVKSVRIGQRPVLQRAPLLAR